MMKDRDLKKKALRYVVAKKWFPQLEMDVVVRDGVSRTNLAITDVDVMALIPDELEIFRKTLIDCKTGKESPIGRALWLRGLMEKLSADRAFCILRKGNVESDHRSQAAGLNVSLYTESDFDKFVIASGVQKFQSVGNIGNIDLWEEFFGLGLPQPKLRPAILFSKESFWSFDNASEACRKTIAHLRSLTPELNPAMGSHFAIVADHVSLFMVALTEIVLKIFANHFQPHKKEELSQALLYLLYNGRDAYDFRSRLLKDYAKAKYSNEVELSLPFWGDFVQLVRQTLDAPFQVCKSPLILREIGWGYLASSNINLDFARELANDSPQAARFAILGTDYLCKAARLPREFARELSNQLIDIQSPLNSQQRLEL